MKHIHSSLSNDMARTIETAMLNSRLDSANCVDYRTHSPASLHTQNVMSIYIQPLLRQLHWLPFNYRINYEVATLAYKARSTRSPAYLLPSVSDYAPTRNLRNPHNTWSNVPAIWTQIARGALRNAVPSLWNELTCWHPPIWVIGRFWTVTHFFRLAFIKCPRDCFRSHDYTVKIMSTTYGALTKYT